MQKILSTITAGTLALGLSTSGLIAGQHEGMKKDGSEKATQTTNKQTKTQLVRSSNLIGADLFNTSGDDIGQVNDVVFDQGTGKTSHIVLAAGGFLGIGDKLTPVTWDSVTVKPHDQGDLNVVTTLAKDRLARERSYDKRRLHDEWMKEIPNTPNKKFVRASDVDDAKLFDRNGQHIGAINEVIVDTKSGTVAYAVVNFETSFVNKGDQVTMIPWRLVRQSESASPGYVLQTDKVKVEGATFFKKDSWPNMNDLTWNKQVYDYYTVTPYYWSGV